MTTSKLCLIDSRITNSRIFIDNVNEENHVPKEYYGSINKAKNTLKIKQKTHSHIENQTFLEQSYSKNIFF